ncbi:hypothetical protein DFJ73DRAFT_828997 [Zopfochytrium polystomum]|nr:hypothetical protein DFJ73DRAFT_828997 [Zopfochytrium polystomum]
MGDPSTTPATTTIIDQQFRPEEAMDCSDSDLEVLNRPQIESIINQDLVHRFATENESLKTEVDRLRLQIVSLEAALALAREKDSHAASVASVPDGTAPVEASSQILFSTSHASQVEGTNVLEPSSPTPPLSPVTPTIGSPSSSPSSADLDEEDADLDSDEHGLLAWPDLILMFWPRFPLAMLDCCLAALDFCSAHNLSSSTPLSYTIGRSAIAVPARLHAPFVEKMEHCIGSFLDSFSDPPLPDPNVLSKPESTTDLSPSAEGEPRPPSFESEDFEARQVSSDCAPSADLPNIDSAKEEKAVVQTSKTQLRPSSPPAENTQVSEVTQPSAANGPMNTQAQMFFWLDALRLRWPTLPANCPAMQHARKARHQYFSDRSEVPLTKWHRYSIQKDDLESFLDFMSERVGNMLDKACGIDSTERKRSATEMDFVDVKRRRVARITTLDSHSTSKPHRVNRPWAVEPATEPEGPEISWLQLLHNRWPTFTLEQLPASGEAVKMWVETFFRNYSLQRTEAAEESSLPLIPGSLQVTFLSQFQSVFGSTMTKLFGEGQSVEVKVDLETADLVSERENELPSSRNDSVESQDFQSSKPIRAIVDPITDASEDLMAWPDVIRTRWPTFVVVRGRPARDVAYRFSKRHGLNSLVRTKGMPTMGIPQELQVALIEEVERECGPAMTELFGPPVLEGTFVNSSKDELKPDTLEHAKAGRQPPANGSSIVFTRPTESLGMFSAASGVPFRGIPSITDENPDDDCFSGDDIDDAADIIGGLQSPHARIDDDHDPSDPRRAQIDLEDEAELIQLPWGRDAYLHHGNVKAPLVPTSAIGGQTLKTNTLRSGRAESSLVILPSTNALLAWPDLIRTLWPKFVVTTNSPVRKLAYSFAGRHSLAGLVRTASRPAVGIPRDLQPQFMNEVVTQWGPWLDKNFGARLPDLNAGAVETEIADERKDHADDASATTASATLCPPPPLLLPAGIESVDGSPIPATRLPGDLGAASRSNAAHQTSAGLTSSLLPPPTPVTTPTPPTERHSPKAPVSGESSLA